MAEYLFDTSCRAPPLLNAMSASTSAADDLSPVGSVTALLNSSRDDPAAWAALWRRVRDEVADVYARAIGRPNPHPHDDPRLADVLSNLFLNPRVWKSRVHFFAFLYTTLQNVNYGEHRRATAVKRGGGRTPLPLADFDQPADGDRAATVKAVERIRTLLNRLAEEHPRVHLVLELKMQQRPWAAIAEAVGVSPDTASHLYEFGKGWLRAEFARLDAGEE